MAKVFISYSSKDSNAAKNIAEMLREHGIEPWLAEEQVLPGDRIFEKIQKAIKESEYFIVLLSQNSLKSKWVSMELGAALSRAAEGTGSRILPVILDDVQLPANIRSILYIDLRQNFKDGIDRIVSAVSQPTPLDAESLSNEDTEQVAKELEKEQIRFKGAGYLITTILGIATLIVSGISAFFSYQQVYKNQPQVFYSIREDITKVPPNIDPQKFSQALTSNQISPTTLQVNIVNKGDNVAKEIQAGIPLPQKAMYHETEPPASPVPVWVKIETAEELGKNGTYYYTYKFKDLIQEKPVKAFLGYDFLQKSPSVEVIYDGKPATRVNSIEEAKAESFVDIFKTPIEILIFGIVITLIAGFMVVLINNPRLRDATLLIIKELNPTLSGIFDFLIKIMRV